MARAEERYSDRYEFKWCKEKIREEVVSVSQRDCINVSMWKVCCLGDTDVFSM